MKRRAILKMFGVAPAVILTPGLLMPVRPVSIIQPLWWWQQSEHEVIITREALEDYGVTLNSIEHPVNRQLYIQRLALGMRRTKSVLRQRQYESFS